MNEYFLHYVWKFQKLISIPFNTTSGETVEIEKVGQHNHGEGPDFFNAQIRIQGQLWAGNVEIHLKSSDWYAHHHERDPNYDSVILHVVWEHDVEVFRAEQTALATLEIKNLVVDTAIANYKILSGSNHNWIPCELHFANVNIFVRAHWLERLYVERLEEKSEQMQETLRRYHNNWDALLFVMLCKNFGLQLNGDSFYSLVRGIDYGTLRKCMKDPIDLESLLLGRAGLLGTGEKDEYQFKLWMRYQFLVTKFRIVPFDVIPPKFFRLRPSNFPTIRLSQFAQLMSTHHRLFSEITSTTAVTELRLLFKITASEYWDTHFNFGVSSKKYPKKLSPAFIELLCINTVIPLLYCYGMYSGSDVSEKVMSMATLLSAEKNTLTAKFEKIGHSAGSALESQGLLQLHKKYCLQSKCLQCEIGNTVLKRS